jgi:hypothetical protein
LLIGPVAAWVYRALRRAKVGTVAIVLAAVLALFVYAVYEVTKASLSSWLQIIIGIVVIAAAIVAYSYLRKQQAANLSLMAAGVAGSLTNTVLVLTAAVLRHVLEPPVAWFIGAIQGAPEAIASAIIVVAVVTAVLQMGNRQQGSRL